MKTTATRLARLLHGVTYPVRLASGAIRTLAHMHLPTCISSHIRRRHLEFTIGTAVVFLGVFIAKCSVLCGHGFWHLAIDGLGYTIHGIGAAPIIKVVCEWLGTEV